MPRNPMAGLGRTDEDSIQFYYYPEDNAVYDEDGYPLFCPYQYLTIDEWRYFKDTAQPYFCKKMKEGYFVEFIRHEDDVT